MGRHGGGSRSGGSHRSSSSRRSGGSRSGGSGARTSSKPFAGCYNRSYYDRSADYIPIIQVIKILVPKVPGILE